MAAEDDGEDSKEAWDQRIKDLALLLFTKAPTEETGVLERVKI